MKLPRRSSVRVGFVAIHSAPFASAIRQTPRYQRVGGERRLGAKGDLACIRHALSATLRWPLGAYEFDWYFP
jgi:hypothetical protein